MHFDITTEIEQAFLEDIPNGDITTDALGMKNKIGIARLKAKQDLVLSGSEIFEAAILHLEKNTQLQWHFKDGDKIYEGQYICDLEGDLLKILMAERVSLNYLGFFSGIASLTRAFVEEVQNTETKILDTRKTFPRWRTWIKKAVQDGGGKAHRFSLSDKILIKENHIRAVGGFEKCLQQVRENFIGPIEVETTNIEEVKLAVKFQCERIMLDNMSNASMQEALLHIPSHIETEASGNMTLERVKSVAQLGVNFISVGAITHSAPVADMSLLFHWEER